MTPFDTRHYFDVHEFVSPPPGHFRPNNKRSKDEGGSESFFVGKPKTTDAVWIASRYSGLPEISSDLPSSTRLLLVIAGGLSLVLSRLSDEESGRKYPYTRQLLMLLRKELRASGKTSASGALVTKVVHEVSQLVDPSTEAALKRFVDARAADAQ